MSTSIRLLPTRSPVFLQDQRGTRVLMRQYIQVRYLALLDRFYCFFCRRFLLRLSAKSNFLAFTDRHAAKKRAGSELKFSFEENIDDEDSSGILCYYSRFILFCSIKTVIKPSHRKLQSLFVVFLFICCYVVCEKRFVLLRL